MKLAYTFFSGLVIGAACMLVFLGEKGRLVSSAPQPGQQHVEAPVAEEAPEETQQIPAPGEVTHAETEPVPPQTDPAPPTRIVAVPASASNLIVPVAGIRPDQLTQSFSDKRGGGRIHEALDILAPRGRPVLAVADGVVRKLFLSRAGGMTIYQESTDGALMYYYAHLDRYADGIREGNRVRRGQLIGYVGSSGNASPDAPHLHFAIFRLPPGKEWWKGDPIDPYPLLTGGR